MAAADTFEVTIRGRGGHGAMPHLAADPVVAAAAVVGALQPLVSRETSPTDGAVVTVARFNTGASSAPRLGCTHCLPNVLASKSHCSLKCPASRCATGVLLHLRWNLEITSVSKPLVQTQ